MTEDQKLYYLAGYRLGYSVGLIEGEGCFSVYLSKRDNIYNYAIEISMTDLEPLIQYQKINGGNINGPYYPKNPQSKPYFKWGLYTRELVLELSKKLQFFLSPRRQQAIKNLQMISEQNPRILRVSEHGTISRYTGGKCRCSACRTAWAKYKREYAKK